MSYNGYYISFPRKRRGSDSLHSHQTIIRKSIYALYFYGRPSEKTCEARLLALLLKLIIIIFCFIWGEAVGDFLPPLAPDHNKKEHLCSLFLWSPVRERLRSSLTRTIFCPTYLQNLMIMLVPYLIIPNSYNLTGFRLQISILK